MKVNILKLAFLALHNVWLKYVLFKFTIPSFISSILYLILLQLFLIKKSLGCFFSFISFFFGVAISYFPFETYNSKYSDHQTQLALNNLNKIAFRTKRLFSSQVTPQSCIEKPSSEINPWFISGFTDGEGSFSMSIVANQKSKTGWVVQLVYKIALSKKDLFLLENIKNFFNVGKIYKHGAESVQFLVGSVKDLEIIISHFDSFGLITQKRVDFELFKKVFYMVQKKEHLTLEGLHKIVAIRASLNFGLSDSLKLAFSSVVPLLRPSSINEKILEPYWLAGFASAEGCFIITVSKASDRKAGAQVRLAFDITQHQKDEQLIRGLVEFFGCGDVYKNRGAFRYIVNKLSDLNEKIIPFFVKYPIQGKKLLDFQDWCKVAEMMKEKKHLTIEGLNEICVIKAGINRGRN